MTNQTKALLEGIAAPISENFVKQHKATADTVAALLAMLMEADLITQEQADDMFFRRLEQSISELRTSADALEAENPEGARLDRGEAEVIERYAQSIRIQLQHMKK